MTFDDVRKLLSECPWRFAKTMPQNPHDYTLRREWVDLEREPAFVEVVQYIRDHGYRARFEGRAYVQLDVGAYYYWTMGAPLPVTILINRKKIERRADGTDNRGALEEKERTPAA